MSRILSPYEKNHLIRHGIDPLSIDLNDETPVEYVTGRVDFCGHTFEISPSALIPRVETEELVAMAVDEALKNRNEKILIADVGTGSGAAAISIGMELVKKSRPFSIFASDISVEALDLARNNRAALLTDDDLQKNKSDFKILESDLLNGYPEKKFDILLANLPYIPSERIDYLESSVKDYEPRIALDGGQSGFELIAKFLNQAPGFLSSAGVILLELDYTHDESIFSGLRDRWNFELIRDGFNNQRFAKLRKK